MRSKNAPDIYDFLDAAHYLTEHYNWRKSSEDSFSIQAWADELNEISETLLRSILRRRRRITAPVLTLLSANIGLDTNQQSYFEHLVEYSQAETKVKREALGQKLLKLNQSQFTQSKVDTSLINFNVMASTVLALLSFQDIPKEPATFASLLDAPVEEIEDIFARFIAADLLKANDDGKLELQGRTLKIVDSAHLRGFYEYWIDRTKAALDLPFEQRRYRTLQFALSEEEFKEAIEKINDYSLNLLARYQSDLFAGRRLYMYESCIFPVSSSLERTLVTDSHDVSITPNPTLALSVPITE